MENKISVIIPAYNIEAYLERTLDSVLAQTYPHIEIIVVNDGSADGTGAVIDRYAAKHSHIKAIHKENGGVTSARLRGVEEASGDWIGFVDGDDYIEPDMYKQLLENALKYNADISHCGFQRVFPDRIDVYYNTGRLELQDQLQGCIDLLSGVFIEPGVVNKLFRRELFRGITELMDPSIRINEDLLLNYYLFQKSEKSVYHDCCPYHYIVRKGSASTARLNKHKLWDPLKVTHIIMNHAGIDLQHVLLQRLTRQLITGATMFLSRQPELVRPFRRETRAELRQRLPQILVSRCGTVVKIMAVWAAVWPVSYGWIHQIYAKLRGYDKKYDII